MGKRRGIYRLFDSKSKSYISVINGVVSYDQTISCHSALAYDLDDALQIKRIITKACRKHQLDPHLFSVPTLIPVNINEIPIPNVERKQAILAAPYLGLTEGQALSNARWQRVRKNKQYFHLHLS